MFFIEDADHVVREIECADCGRVWTLTAKRDDEGKTMWFWKADPEPADAEVKRRAAFAAARAKKARKKSSRA